MKQVMEHRSHSARPTLIGGACLLLALLLPMASAAELPKVFQIDTGYLSGWEVDRGENDEAITAFLGIPYAEPPVGELRFRPPRPALKWEALYEGIVPGPSCMQPAYPAESFYSSPKEETSEDCLYLNVWTGAQSPEEKRPVMVWIHGGALTRGSGANPVYDGTNLAKKGVVLVTINYRLGPFGYFAHPALSKEDAEGSSGNYGVLDQIARTRVGTAQHPPLWRRSRSSHHLWRISRLVERQCARGDAAGKGPGAWLPSARAVVCSDRCRNCPRNSRTCLRPRRSAPRWRRAWASTKRRT